MPVVGKLQKGVKHTQVFLPFLCSCPGTEVKGTSRPKLQGMRQKGGERVPGLCLPAQQDPKSWGEGHDILWPSQTGGQSSSVAALVPGRVTGCDTSTAAKTSQSGFAQGSPQKARSSRARAALSSPGQHVGLFPAPTASWGLPSPRGERREAPTSTALGLWSRETILQRISRAAAAPWAFLPSQGRSRSRSRSRAAQSGHVAGDSPEGVEQSRLHACLQQEQVDVHLQESRVRHRVSTRAPCRGRDRAAPSPSA